jgi:hypothetical protein
VTDPGEQVACALRAAAVASPTSISWFGRRTRAVPPVRLGIPVSAYLAHELEGVLYRGFYTQGAPVPLPALLPMPASSAPDFVEALSRANAGRGGWQSGWQVTRRDGPDLEVARNGLRVQVRATDCRPANAATVSLRRPKEQRAASPGFYVALGDAVPAIADDDVEVRVYFHLIAAGAARFVATCTRMLNEAGVPFELKVVGNPAAYVRCDAAVLYLAAGDFGRAPLQAIVATGKRYLRATVPAFAKPLAAGVAVGEHRASLGGSFGMGRCRLVAEGIVDAYEHGGSGLDAVARRFADVGLSLETPHLVPGSRDEYAL